MMAYNIHTGRNVTQRDNDQIVILVPSLGRLQESSVSFVITDRHACAATVKYSNKLEHLESIDWRILQNSDFRASGVISESGFQ